METDPTECTRSEKKNRWVVATCKAQKPVSSGCKETRRPDASDGLRPFGFAGLWEHWDKGVGAAIDSCTILTTTPNDLLRPLHHRMAVILAPETYDLWLDPAIQEAERLQHLLQPYPSEQMTAYPVSTVVNNPANDTPRCTEPLRL